MASLTPMQKTDMLYKSAIFLHTYEAEKFKTAKLPDGFTKFHYGVGLLCKKVEEKLPNKINKLSN